MNNEQSPTEEKRREHLPDESYSGATDVAMVADSLGVSGIPILNLILLLVLLPFLVCDLIRFIPRLGRAARNFASLLDLRLYINDGTWW